MKKILCLIICSICIIGSFGCASEKTYTFTETEVDNIKDYVNFTNIYIEAQIAKSPLAPRVFAEPYRARYQLVQDTLNK